MTSDRIRQIADDAQSAFWARVVELVPEAKSSDFDIMPSIVFDTECQKAIAHWVDLNVPKEK